MIVLGYKRVDNVPYLFVVHDGCCVGIFTGDCSKTTLMKEVGSIWELDEKSIVALRIGEMEARNCGVCSNKKCSHPGESILRCSYFRTTLMPRRSDATSFPSRRKDYEGGVEAFRTITGGREVPRLVQSLGTLGDIQASEMGGK